MTNGQYIFSLIIFGSLLLVLFVFAITSFVFIHRQKTARQQLEMNDALLKARIEVQEQALKSLSMEIHDKLGQSFSMARMLLTKGMTGAGGAVDRAALQKAAELLAEANSGLRTLAYTLNAEVVAVHGLPAAIENELAYIRNIYNLRCAFSCPAGESFGDLDEKEQLFLFRIIQEALQNVVKHARATEVSIHMQRETGLMRVSIRDNGIGIRGTEGLGLIGMRERARLLNAALEIQALPEGGSEVLLIKEINQDENCN